MTAVPEITPAQGSSRAEIESTKQRLSAAGVRYLFGAYVDMHGVPKSKCVPIEHFEDYVAGSELYTVGALEGMGELGPNEDECTGIPDLAALTVLPWDRRYALAPANLFLHGEPYSHDSRYLLQRQIDEAALMGYRFNMGVEPEFYVMRPSEDGFEPWIAEDTVNAPTRGYDIDTTMLADAFLEPMVQYMDELGWDVYSFDHEGGAGQYEFDFRYTDGMAMADRMVLLRLMAKHVARSLGCIATFMPKPSSQAFGSGAHFNMSLAHLETGANAFEKEGTEGRFDLPAQDGYSELAYQFTAGVLAHSGAIAAIVCPTVNSYKRLLPRGLMNEISWAPVFRSYGYNNRTLMCRLPVNRRCLELRIADAACNTHLGAAITLAAGLDGIRRGLDSGPAVNFDTYKASQQELDAAGVVRLPATLAEALDELEASDFAKGVLGADVHKSFLELKRAESLEYNTVVGEWERQRYMQLW
ncbi:MAG: glutamine synthetase [Frankiales bacterium]|nr:glutamine synthetase [Frankiales bacterium]